MLLLGSILISLSAASSAIVKVLYNDFDSSIFRNLNDQWWNPVWSWRNKYKGKLPYLGPKFFLSTTFLIFLTDAVSLFSTFSSLSLCFGMAFVIMGALDVYSTTIMWNALLTFSTHQIAKHLFCRSLK
jgi:hypothetical protein